MQPDAHNVQWDILVFGVEKNATFVHPKNLHTMEIVSKKRMFNEVGLALFKLTIAGVLIGLFRSYDGILALLLLVKIIHVVYKYVVRPHSKNWVLILGMMLTGVIGLTAEYFGVKYGKWVYHDVDSQLPMWLPFAWMLAFYFLYGVELKLIQNLRNKTLQNKVLIAILLSLIVPAYGEMVTISLGVWTYNMSFKILGVPILAFLALVIIHMMIYGVLFKYCRRFGVSDPVFS